MIETNGNPAGHRSDPTASSLPAQYAQADGATAPPPAAAIGTATKVSGQVTVKHADGSQEALKDGAAIKVGDDIVTGADGKVGLVFDDGSTFALGAKGHMSVDEMTLPSAQGLGGKQTINVDSGAFSLASGAIAKGYPDAMVLKTPVASIGIRGTTVAGQSAPEGSANTVSLLPDADGTVGQVSVTTQAGTQVLSQPGATTQVSSAFAPPAPPVILSPQQLQQQYGDTLQTLPPPPSPEQLQQMQQQRQADAQTEAEQQAEAAANEQAEGEDAATEDAATEQAQTEAEAAQDALGDALDAFFDSGFGDFGPDGDSFDDLINDLNALFSTFDPLGPQGEGEFDLNELIAELGEDITELIDEAIQDLIDDLEDEALDQDVNVFDLSVLGSTYTLESTDGETDYVIGVAGTNDAVTVSGEMGLGDTFIDEDTETDADTLTLGSGTDNVGWRVAGIEHVNLSATTGYDNTFIIGSDGGTFITLASGSGVDS
ncbi:MAG: FecR domain-containing protein, partial [Magnetospirillum sp.]|nr:FecR domain-containing protein [Magnetospirillum sp.]